MSYGLPDDWYIEPTGESLILDQEKVASEIERLRAALGEIARGQDKHGDLTEAELRGIAMRALEQSAQETKK